eukprot:4428558-Prymnesium_polylepis.2
MSCRVTTSATHTGGAPCSPRASVSTVSNESSVLPKPCVKRARAHRFDEGSGAPVGSVPRAPPSAPPSSPLPPPPPSSAGGPEMTELGLK